MEACKDKTDGVCSWALTLACHVDGPGAVSTPARSALERATSDSSHLLVWI